MTLPAGITPDLSIVFGFLLCVSIMFASDRVRVDMVGLLVIVLMIPLAMNMAV